MNKALTLFSVFHKPYPVPRLDFIEPIHAGKAISNATLEMKGDDTGDNISARNPHFCELTVLYYVWKNLSKKDCQYWGLCHYRRYFAVPREPWFKRKKSIYTTTAASLDTSVNDELKVHMLSLLDENALIVTRPFKLSVSNERFFEMEHDHALWVLVREHIANNHPSFLEYFNAMSGNKFLYAYNMMTAGWDTWNEYLSLLFDILFAVYEKYTLPEDPYQARAMGFMAERLLTAFVLSKKAAGMNVHTLPVVFAE